MRGKKRMQVQMTNRDLRKYFDRLYFLQLHLFHSTSFNCLNVARYKFGAVGRILSNKNSLIEQFYFFELRKFSGKIFIFPFRKFLEKIKIHLLQRIHGGTFGNESLLKKTAAERQLQRLRKRKESTSSTTAQQSRRMDASTQTIVRLALVASPLELKTPSYKLLLIVKAVKTLFIELLGRQRILLGREEPYIEKKIIVNLLGQKEPYIEKNNCEFIGPKRAVYCENNCEFYWAEKSRKEVLSCLKKYLTEINEEENIYSENESNSSEEETDKTNTTKTQVGLNKNIEVEKLVEISINTKEGSDSTQRINKEKTKEKSLLDTTVREDSNTGKQELIQEQRIELNVIKESDL
ncbi:hypothetical protein AGLY_006472 [Aphis glycines]|uniref:Uncharacterized protein n=1 Tax=Aphis glycines TaxID=307491 RepID=A0A6G0TS23_APHGL|nr:hypothetical protein AGLY_006472 [Aphis glycines]